MTERNRSNRLMASEKVSELKPKNLVRESRSFTSSSLSLVVILRPLSWEVSMSLKPLSLGWYRPSKSVRAFSWTAKGCAPGVVTVSIICVGKKTGLRTYPDEDSVLTWGLRAYNVTFLCPNLSFGVGCKVADQLWIEFSGECQANESRCSERPAESTHHQPSGVSFHSWQHFNMCAGRFWLQTSNILISGWWLTLSSHRHPWYICDLILTTLVWLHLN